MPSLKKLKHLLHGFTLVELIVVISVLAVLATIAMSQVSNITAWARDSQRMTDMSSMKSSIELYKAKTGKLPLPTNGSGVTYSWGLLWIQGTFGESVVREIKSITPKPIDPINKIEYVYSIANNNREFELGGILEKATGYTSNILPQLLAASQNTTFIEWTYNGISLKVETGSKTYIVAAPSIVASTLGTTIENTTLSIDWLWSLPQWFSWTTTSTAQTGTFTPIIAWSGTKLPDTSTGAQAMIQWLQNAYSWTKATSLSQISSLISATWTQITALWQGLIQNSLGGAAITLPAQTTTGTGTEEESPVVLDPTTDAYSGNVVSLLHFDGNLNDEAGKVWTAAGWTITSVAQSKFWGGSLYLDGVDDKLSINDHADFNFGTGDFTIDAQIYFTGLSAGWIFSRAYPSNNWCGFSVTPTSINFVQGTSGGTAYSVTTPNLTNSWHHVAVTRSNSTLYIFLDGVLQNSWPAVGFDFTNASVTKVGIGDYGHINQVLFKGYIDELRVTKWVARWTSNFTPPTAATFVPTSQLLGSTSTNPWTTCKAIYDAGRRIDGIYWIKPDSNAAFQAYCDMTTDGGGWTLLHLYNSANISSNFYSSTVFASDNNPPLSLGGTTGTHSWNKFSSVITSSTVLRYSNNKNSIKRYEKNITLGKFLNADVACYTNVYPIGWDNNGTKVDTSWNGGFTTIARGNGHSYHALYRGPACGNGIWDDEGLGVKYILPNNNGTFNPMIGPDTYNFTTTPVVAYIYFK